MVLMKVVLTVFTSVVCCNLAFGIALPDFQSQDDSVSSRRSSSLYLLELLQRLDELATAEQELRRLVPGRNSYSSATRTGSGSAPRFGGYGNGIEKKDYAILPPANEWCRLMGFRRCRQSRS